MLPPRVDVLLVAEGTTPPHVLLRRADHVVRVPGGGTSPSLIAALRGRIPRLVGVSGEPPQAIEMARAVHRAGFPTVLFTEDRVEPPEGVEWLPADDDGPTMEVADSVLDLIGDTPLVRLDRIGRDLPCHLLAKLE
ncbi:MAG: hypothetical protein WBW80_01030, partial [Acidimicrobiales bacterium]